MRKEFITLIGLSVGLLWLLGSTTPSSVGLSIYLLIFSIIYMIVVLVIFVVTGLAYSSVSVSKKLFIAFILAFCPVLILALESMSAVSLLDILLAISAPSVIVWYGLKKIY